MDSAEESKYSVMSEGNNWDSLSLSGPPGVLRSRRALATVYDAVAGRVTFDKVLRDESRDHKKSQTGVVDDQQRSVRDTFKLPPEDVLFRRKDAPERYEEHDIYRAHEWELPNGGRGVLPESDLLKAIHEYSSEFYSVLNRGQQQRQQQQQQRFFREERSVDECSMDETALLAFGILLEEAGKEILGRHGHLVFTEGIESENSTNNDEGPDGDGAAQDSGRVIGHQEVGSWRLRTKRRKVAKTDEES